MSRTDCRHCRKKNYSRTTAMFVALKQKSRVIRVYHCPHGSAWHLTHEPYRGGC